MTPNPDRRWRLMCVNSPLLYFYGSPYEFDRLLGTFQRERPKTTQPTTSTGSTAKKSQTGSAKSNKVTKAPKVSGYLTVIIHLKYSVERTSNRRDLQFRPRDILLRVHHLLQCPQKKRNRVFSKYLQLLRSVLVLQHW